MTVPGVERLSNVAGVEYGMRAGVSDLFGPRLQGVAVKFGRQESTTGNVITRKEITLVSGIILSSSSLNDWDISERS